MVSVLTAAGGRAEDPHGVDLGHHGDADATPGLVDLAVNVAAGPPAWMIEAITDSLQHLQSYPDDSAATRALATAHDVDPDCVLVTAGAAEAFTLIARARLWRRPVVVHPQFTEPEAALRAAGHSPDRLLLTARDGFALTPEQRDRIDPGADLIMIGNPTNPTGVLHPAATIRDLVGAGRVVVVDEAFGDAVPGEPETMISRELDGVLVVRSLTKTWAIPGLRAGYAVGDADLIAALRRQQPPWSVSTPALAALVAGSTERARTRSRALAEAITRDRASLVAVLAAVGLPVAGTPRGPFVLVDTAGWLTDPRPDAVRHELRGLGFAVRRGETFPGLGPTWIRMAVRDRQTTTALGAALAVIRERDGR